MNNAATIKIQAARIGDKVEANDGFTVRTGRVYGRITDRWGFHLRVKFDDCTFTTCHNFTKVGIGFYWKGR